MIAKKFVSHRVPENSINHHHHHHEDGKRQGRQKVPLFIESDKNGPHFVARSEKDVPRFKENVNKANPFIRDIGRSEKGRHMGHFSNAIPSQRSKLRERGAKKERKGVKRDKKRGRSRNRFNPKKAGKKSEEERIQRGRRQEDLKRKEVERQKGTKGGKSNFVTKKGRRRSKKQAAGPLTASDLWSLNR